MKGSDAKRASLSSSQFLGGLGCSLSAVSGADTDLWEPYFGLPSLDLILTPMFCPQVYASSQPLRVGYYETDNYTMPTPAMKRALLETKKSLEAAGHTVWLWEPRSPGMAPPSGKPSWYPWLPPVPGILSP